MNVEVALNIAKRFVTLPTEKRRLYLEKMYAENISPANLPVPSVQALFDCIPLSFAQQRQWFLWQLDPSSSAYNIPTALKLTGSLNHEALRLSFQTLIERHETLRTTFRQDNDQSIQVIHPSLPFNLIVDQLSPQQTVAQYVDEEIRRPFDLHQGPLLRVKLLGLARDEHILVLTMHHIISDGWSTPIIVNEMIKLYEAFNAGRSADLAALPIQYADYSIWQRNWMEAGEQERQLEYWLGKLGGQQPVLELPADRARPSIIDSRGAVLHLSIDTTLVKKLKALAQNHGCTLFMVLLSSFQCLLHRYSGQNDIRIGVPAANRTRVETEGLVGFFVNTQVLKADFERDTSFETLLQQVRQTVLEAQTYQELPFEQLVEALQPDRSVSHNPLFQVMFNHQTHSQGAAQEISGLHVEELPQEGVSSQFDLTLHTFEDQVGIGASLNYATALFDASTIEQLGRHWLQLLEQVVREPEQRIAELPLLNTHEQQQIVSEWNRSEVSYPTERCLHQRIEQQVLNTPEAMAVVFEDQSLSYTELNQRANRLAHKLREQGVGPDVLVGLAVERSLEMVVGLLAILKAGGAYVPLDPQYPEDRLSYLMQDSGIGLLLTQSHLIDSLPTPEQVQVLNLDEVADSLAAYSDTNPVNLSHPDNLAYVIYTSGSTGKPKGTLLPHHNVLRLFQATEAWFGFNAQDVWTVFHSYAFDFSVWELYGALLYGGKAVIVPKEVSRSPEHFHALLKEEGVTVLNQTPSAFKQLIPVACESTADLALRYVVFGGEALDVGSLAPWFERFGDQQPQLINMYGITETTVHVTYRPLSKADLQQASISPIGEVIPDLSWYLLDGQLNPAIPGVHGELHIGRAGLARGYHNRAALTAERFIPNPFDSSEAGGSRLYRSGDLGRSRVGGVVEYAGRIDHQVKIRGFRIELGEIEARVKEHPGIREAVVLDMDGPADRQLVAYLVPVTEQTQEQQAALRASLREHLKTRIPDYMVPAHFICLESLPLTGNGKLDRKALPSISTEQHPGYEVALPRTKMERQLASIWAAVLGVDSLALHDNFFEVGGNSILLLSALRKIREQIDESYSMHEFMQGPTIKEQADILRSRVAGFKSCLIKLNSCQEGARIYCLPPAAGAVFSYYPLAHALNGVCPVYALLNKGYVEPGFKYKDWDDMVCHYLSEIRLSQPAGPYNLLGWSSGGALAIDIAHRLETEGERVNLLALIDPMLPESFGKFNPQPISDDQQAPLDPASLGARNREAMIMIRGFFPEVSDDHILQKIIEGRDNGLHDDQLAEFMLRELSEEKGIDYETYKEVYDNFSLGAELVVGYDIYGDLTRLAQAFELRALTVRPECWWSSLQFNDVDGLERAFIEQCAVNGIAASESLAVPHARMVLVPEFLSGFESRVRLYLGK